MTKADHFVASLHVGVGVGVGVGDGVGVGVGGSDGSVVFNAPLIIKSWVLTSYRW